MKGRHARHLHHQNKWVIWVNILRAQRHGTVTLSWRHMLEHLTHTHAHFIVCFSFHWPPDYWYIVHYLCLCVSGWVCFESCVPLMISSCVCVSVCISESCTCCSTRSKFCCSVSANPKPRQSTHPPTGLSTCQPRRSLSSSHFWRRPCPGLDIVFLAIPDLVRVCSCVLWCGCYLVDKTP